MANIAYIRADLEQLEDEQLAVAEVVVDNTVVDRCKPGSSFHPGLENINSSIGPGDTLHLHSLTHLTDNIADLLDHLTRYMGDGVTVICHEEKLTFSPAQPQQTAALLAFLRVLTKFSHVSKPEENGADLMRMLEDNNRGRKPLLEIDVLKDALLRHKGNKTAAARELGVSYRTVLRSCQRAGLA